MDTVTIRNYNDLHLSYYNVGDIFQVRRLNEFGAEVEKAHVQVTEAEPDVLVCNWCYFVEDGCLCENTMCRPIDRHDAANIYYHKITED